MVHEPQPDRPFLPHAGVASPRGDLPDALFDAVGPFVEDSCEDMHFFYAHLRSGGELYKVSFQIEKKVVRQRVGYCLIQQGLLRSLTERVVLGVDKWMKAGVCKEVRV